MTIVNFSEIFFLALILAMYVQSIHIAFHEGMIFEKTGVWLDEHVNEFVLKPLIDCPICMTPWHGSLLLGVLMVSNTLTWPGIFIFGLILFVAMGINAVISTFLATINKKHDE